MTSEGWCLVAAISVMHCGAATPPREVASAKPVVAGFYAQHVDFGAIPILGSTHVSERGLNAARDHLEALLHHATRIRRNLEARQYELHVMALDEMPSDLPEYKSRRGDRERGQLFDWHMIGGHISEDAAHFSSCSEGTLLPIVGHRLFADDTCFHELAHAIEWFAFDAAMRARILVEYKASIESGHWKGEYAATNEHEWFAEVTKLRFRPDRPELVTYEPTSLPHGHDWLCSYDERACKLVDDVFEDRIDPGKPKTIALAPAPGTLEHSIKSTEGRVPSRVVVRNHTSAHLHLVWIDYDGNARKPFVEQPIVMPNAERALYTYATHAFVISDDAEHAMCTFIAPDEEAIVDVDGECR